MTAWLARAWEAWKGVAHYIGNFQARLLLTLLYFSWLVPFGLLVRLCSDPLDMRRAATPDAATGWKKRAAPGHGMHALRSQF